MASWPRIAALPLERMPAGAPGPGRGSWVAGGFHPSVKVSHPDHDSEPGFSEEAFLPSSFLPSARNPPHTLRGPPTFSAIAQNSKHSGLCGTSDHNESILQSSDRSRVIHTLSVAAFESM